MDLYISPLSCSFAAHMCCLEAELPVTLRRVDRITKRLDDGTDYRTIAPLAIVPALSIGGGTVITEMAAVLQWIADRAPGKHLAPAWGSPERYELISWIHFVSTELHKKHAWMIFSTKTPAAVKEWARADPSAPLDHAAKRLETRPYLSGDGFTVADAYLFWSLLVLPFGGVPLSRWPTLEAYAARVRERPSARAALAIEFPMFQKEQAAAQAVALQPGTQLPASVP
jgi:glutathione S-transferase